MRILCSNLSYTLMKLFRILVACSSVTALLLTGMPVAEARMMDAESNTTFRGFRRSISRVRDAANRECNALEGQERSLCIRSRREDVRRSQISVPDMNTGGRCSDIINVGDQQNCNRGRGQKVRSRTRNRGGNRPIGIQGRVRLFGKRTRTREVKEQREECRSKETSAEKLECLRMQSRGTRRDATIITPRRRTFQQIAPVDFLSPQGLRRNISRTRNIIHEKCGDIEDGNEKRACINTTRTRLQGY